MKPDGRIRVMEIIARMNVGGPATQILGLYERLNLEEFDHRLYTGQVEENESDRLGVRDGGARIHRVAGLGRSVRPADDWRALLRLAAEMRAFRPHIVHTRTAKAGALGRVAARLARAGSAWHGGGPRTSSTGICSTATSHRSSAASTSWRSAGWPR
ncbi:hypothetical protein GCM10027612_57310 [Microbispora bryophytorum subsp. camponoti]